MQREGKGFLIPRIKCVVYKVGEVHFDGMTRTLNVQIRYCSRCVPSPMLLVLYLLPHCGAQTPESSNQYVDGPPNQSEDAFLGWWVEIF